jgi:hypothetical protein
MKAIGPYLTVGSIYIATDVLADFGFVALPQPYSFVFFASRYGAVIAYTAIKIVRKHARGQ